MPITDPCPRDFACLQRSRAETSVNQTQLMLVTEGHSSAAKIFKEGSNLIMQVPLAFPRCLCTDTRSVSIGMH